MDQGLESITDADERAAVRRQARVVMLQSVGLAAALTLAVWLWP